MTTDGPNEHSSVEPEPMEVEQPRRAASAQLAVDADVGSEAALREAMDPANQSLADALRLSFRVLQVVIFVLLGLFLVSGFQTVEKGQSGVMLRFGRIVTVDDQQALQPGLRHNLLPFPAGEFVIFDVENRGVDLGDAFWPRIPPNRTLEQAVDAAAPRGAIRPGRDGSVITGDADLAHLKVHAAYEITDPVRFVERLNVAEANVDRVVRLALQRAVVHTAARLTLAQLVDSPDDVIDGIRKGAQRALDDLDCGIDLTDVKVPDTRPPLSIVKVYRELQNAREESRREIEKARQDAVQTLINMVGADFDLVADLIERFEEARDLGDDAESRSLLMQINAFLESGQARGEVSEILLRAEAYESEIELTLGNEARRFAQDLRTYRKSPELFTSRRWLKAYTAVLEREDSEVFKVPPGLGSIDLSIMGSEEVQKQRRRNMLQRKELEAALRTTEIIMPRSRTAESFEFDESNPLLEVGPDGTIRPKGSGR